MNKRVSILGGVFAFQALLFVILYRQSSSVTSANHGAKAGPLFTLTWDQVDKITIETADKKTLDLVKKEQTWVLSNRWDFPISVAKLKETLEALPKTESSWPVGKTPIAAKQFHVTDEQFEVRVTYAKGADLLAKVYLGSSPSFKKVHARVDGQDQTYAVEFNTHDLSADPNQWFQKNVYEKQRADVKSVSWKDIVLENENDIFKLAGVSQDKETDAMQVSSLLLTALNPDFEDVLGKEEGDFASLKDALVYTVEMKNGDKTVFTFKEPKEGEKSDFLSMRVSGQAYTFQIRKSRVDNLIQATKEKLEKNKGEIASAKEPIAPLNPALGETPEPSSDESMSETSDGEVK